MKSSPQIRAPLQQQQNLTRFRLLGRIRHQNGRNQAQTKPEKGWRNAASDLSGSIACKHRCEEPRRATHNKALSRARRHSFVLASPSSNFSKDLALVTPGAGRPEDGEWEAGRRGPRRVGEVWGATGGRGGYHPPRDEILKLGVGGQSGLRKGCVFLTHLSRELLGRRH